MTAFERFRMRSLNGAEWLNSEPLGPAMLPGHVLVNFSYDGAPA